MSLLRIIVLITSIVLSSVLVQCQVKSVPKYSGSKISGLTMVAPPRKFKENPLPPIQAMNAQWITLVPYGFTRKGQSDVIYKGMTGQWWGETIPGIIESINLAHEAGIKVLLKPQVFIPGGWVGDMDFDKEEDWINWEEGYYKYIMTLLDICTEKNVEAFCVGTEYKIATKKREKFWRKLIKDIRQKYDGLLTYSSNWDNYENLPFWDALDLIGISAYFPLSDSKTPEVDQLKKEWKPIKKKLKKFARRNGKSILFTEFGYLSVDGCAYRTWELEKKVRDTPINELAQANAYQALLETFIEETYWAGGFLWKWFPNMMGHEGYPERDYTPQGKLAEKTVANLYLKMKQ